MAIPSILPTGFQGDYTDFLHVKAERSGDVRRVSGSVSVPAITATDTIIGLFPFTSGMSLAGISGYNVAADDMDTGSALTLDWGVAYQDSTQGTDNLTLITAASTAAQAGGFLTPTNTAFMNYSTTGNGWVTVQVNQQTFTSGAITFNIPFAYDQPALVI